jgi:hypothetical protein
MSHVTIIISRARPFTEAATPREPELSYSYEMPIPHGTTPAQVGELVRKAYRRLEGADHEGD